MLKQAALKRATKLNELLALMTIAVFDGGRHDAGTNLHILILKLI